MWSSIKDFFIIILSYLNGERKKRNVESRSTEATKIRTDVKRMSDDDLSDRMRKYKRVRVNDTDHN